MAEPALLVIIGGMLISRINNYVFDSITSRLKEQFIPSISETENRLNALMEGLDEINAKLELNSARHLKAGLTFMRLAYFDEAIKRFIDADAIDSRSALAKFWLGLLLFHNGKHSDGLKFIESALDLNPYILHLAIDLSATDEDLIHKDPANDCDLNDHPIWQRDINDAISSVSLSGRNLIVESRYSRNVSAYDISTGKELWSRSCNHPMRLFFATPTFVVLFDSETHGSFDFLSQRNGKYHSRMQASYFTTIFCPDISRLVALPTFQKSNATLPSHEDSFSEMRSDTKRYKDKTLLIAPLSTLETKIQVENNWKLKKQYDTYTSFDGLYSCDTSDVSSERTSVIQCFGDERPQG